MWRSFFFSANTINCQLQQVFEIKRSNDIFDHQTAIISVANYIIIAGIGVARILDWGAPNHKSHAMTSSEIFEREFFVG